MLAFTSVYFLESGLFNGLRPFGVKNFLPFRTYSDCAMQTRRCVLIFRTRTTVELGDEASSEDDTDDFPFEQEIVVHLRFGRRPHLGEPPSSWPSLSRRSTQPRPWSAYPQSSLSPFAPLTDAATRTSSMICSVGVCGVLPKSTPGVRELARAIKLTLPNSPFILKASARAI
jgi:hypothetical protein